MPGLTSLEDQSDRQLDVARTAAAEKRIADTNIRGHRNRQKARAASGYRIDAEVMSAAKLGNSGFEKFG